MYMLVNKDEKIIGCRTFGGTIYHSPRPAGEIQEILRLSNTPWIHELLKINLKLLTFLKPALLGCICLIFSFPKRYLSQPRIKGVKLPVDWWIMNWKECGRKRSWIFICGKIAAFPLQERRKIVKMCHKTVILMAAIWCQDLSNRKWVTLIFVMRSFSTFVINILILKPSLHFSKGTIS